MFDLNSELSVPHIEFFQILLNIKSCLKLKALAITIYMLKFLQIMML